ncbi:MAG: MFS transporter [Halieaceae bacterium]|jgi:MFS family permease|nr:MFS transporter [Halieaceae bacterium]
MTGVDSTESHSGLGAILRAMSALLLGIAILNIGSGALMAIIGVRLAATGTSSLTIGFITSAYYFGLLVGSLFGARVIDRVGHIRAFVVYAAIGALSVLLLVFVGESLAAWLLLRMIAGYGTAGLTMIAESWLNHRATNATRGRVLSVYIIVMNGAFATGPLLLNAGDPVGSGLIVASGILFIAALLPVAMTRTGNPEMGEQKRFGLGKLFALSPLGVIGAVAVGLVESAVFGLGAVYGDAIGLNAVRISIFLAVTLGGVLILQYPLGVLSDRYDREKLILIIALVSALAALVVALVPTLGFGHLLVLAFFVGGLASPLYPLCVAEANDWLEVDELVPAGASLVLAYSLGATLGPLVGSLSMANFGPGGLFAFAAVVLFALAAFALYQIVERLSKPIAEQTVFQPVSWVSAVSTHLDPRAPAEPDYDAETSEYWDDDENE